MKRSNSSLLPFLLLALLTLLSIGKSYASPLSELEQVGSTTLKWMFWTVYDGALFSPDGKYSGIVPGIALKLDYRRNIKSQLLIDTTREQWQDLALYQDEVSEERLRVLGRLWPDINKGDTIILRVETDLSASFYLNEELLGSVSDAGFTRDFLAIWLAENSSFPKLRNQLIGLQ